MPKVITYDLICIGGGSAGFNAARVAADLGWRAAIIDGARELGGLCILRGCMPSKTLLYAAEVMHQVRHAGRFGIQIDNARMDMKRLHARKRAIIGGFAGYRQKALAAGRFALHRATARFLDPHTVLLSNGKRLRARHFLIGTGSRIAIPPIPGLAEAKSWTSDDVLDLDFVPKSVIVLGGGIVACELAQFLRRIGSKVTMVQRSPQLLRDHSAEAAAVVQKSFVDDGIEVLTGTAIRSISQDARGTVVRFLHDDVVKTRRAAHLFDALGREPATQGLGLDAAGVETPTGGQIKTNRWQQTSAAHIYAAGDCAGPAEIVHVAIAQAELAVRHAAKVRGIKPVDYSQLLGVVFTDPQLSRLASSNVNCRSARRRISRPPTHSTTTANPSSWKPNMAT